MADIRVGIDESKKNVIILIGPLEDGTYFNTVIPPSDALALAESLAQATKQL